MNLPSGSGFDCEWELTEYSGYTKCVSAFHVMNEHGYYDGYVDFSVIVFKEKEKIISCETCVHHRSIYTCAKCQSFPKITEHDLWKSNHIPEFNLHFHGAESQYKARKYMLRDCIEDTIACHLLTGELK